MKFTYWPGDESISFEVDSVNFYNGVIGYEDETRSNGRVCVVVSESEDIKEIAMKIIGSIGKKYSISSYYEKSAQELITKRISYKFEDGIIVDRKLHLQIPVGSIGWRSGGQFEISQ